MKKTADLLRKKDQDGFLDHDRYESLSDREIIGQVLEGNIDFFALLIRRYNQQIYRVVRAYLQDEYDIQDVMQNAYLKAFEHLDQFRGDARFSTWLIRITINEALKHLNRAKKYRDSGIEELSSNGRTESMINRETPESRAVRSDFKQLLEESIDSLPHKYRSVVIMRMVEQMSTKETAKCLNITRANVKVRLFRAKNQLRKELEKRVMDCEVFDFKGNRCDRMVRSVMSKVFKTIENNSDKAVRA